jgi:hypothetical protein
MKTGEVRELGDGVEPYLEVDGGTTTRTLTP